MDLNLRCKLGNTALHIAIYKYKIGFIRELVKSNKINPNIHNDKGDTPLMCAIIKNDTDFVTELLKAKDIDLKATNSKGETVISMVNSKDWLKKANRRHQADEIAIAIKKIINNHINPSSNLHPKDKLKHYNLQTLAMYALGATLLIAAVAGSYYVYQSYDINIETCDATVTAMDAISKRASLNAPIAEILL